MAHSLPELPFPLDALEPHMSRETFEYHYGKHHKTYVDKLNAAIGGTEYETMALEDIIKNASGGVFNNAAQAWNHTFFWNCLSPAGGGDPTGALAENIHKVFGSVTQFKEKFVGEATTLFGSGWTWLVRNADGVLEIMNTSNAGNPLTAGAKPILTLDVWEHAYYIDYRNARPKFAEAFWNLVNWEFAAKNMLS